MANPDHLRNPWLVAVWPGMGSVAHLAGAYLVQQLRAQATEKLDATEFFEMQSVEVKNALVAPAPLPRQLFFEWRDPRGPRDLLIFMGESQPVSGGHALCRKLLEYAVGRGVRQFFTFAALSTQVEIGVKPRVYAVATDSPALAMAKGAHVELMYDSQISGLNGVLLAAGAARALQGIGLLSEVPFFAVGVPFPRAAKAVLEAFASITGIDVDLTELDRQAASVEQNLRQLVSRMHKAAGGAGGADEAPGEPRGPAVGPPS